MDNPHGRVESLQSDENGLRAVVGIDVAAACPRCAAGKGCGAGIFVDTGTRRHVEAAVRPGLQLRKGDLVEVALAPENLLRAALIVYGLPMAGAILAAAIAYALGVSELFAAISALAGLGAGLLLGRWRLRREDCLSRFVPTVDKRLGDTVTAGG